MTFRRISSGVRPIVFLKINATGNKKIFLGNIETEGVI